MRAVVPVAEMRQIDAEAQRSVPLEALVERAGRAVARAGLRLLGGAYGRRVVVVAGKGHNGDDGRVAAGRLRRRGVRVTVVEAAEAEGQRLAAPVARAVLSGYRHRYGALADAVTETEPAFDDARLADVDLVDLLVAPVHVLAARWRGG